MKKVEENDLKHIFQKYGTILSVSIKQKRDNFAFIKYKHIADAEEAFNKYFHLKFN